MLPSTDRTRLRRVDLDVRKRLDGLLQGDHQGRLGGPGSESGDARVYVAGDDVRRIDWSVTARTGSVHVRETIADHELDLTLVVDTSASLEFGTALATKRAVAQQAALAFAHLANRGGNRVGVFTSGTGSVRIPHRGGDRHLASLARQLVSCDWSGPGDLSRALRHARRTVGRRGLVVVVSDFREQTGWDRELRGASHRHETIAVEVVDRRELELPDVGLLNLVDPETGRRRRVDTSDEGLRNRFAAAAADQCRRTRKRIADAGAAHLTLRTDREPVADIVRWLGDRRIRAAEAR